LDITAVI